MKNYHCIANQNWNDAWRMSGSRGSLPAIIQAGSASPRMFASRDGPVMMKEESDEQAENECTFLTLSGLSTLTG
jgi:hypothetical protein